MESAISQVQTGNKFSALSASITKVQNGVSFPVSCFVAVEKTLPKKVRALRVNCGKEVSSLNWEKEEEMIEMKKLISEKCKQGADDVVDGGFGIVELLECLENEAIMGEDKGRDPNDYNRRALIFDKSSRVFQALKHVQNNTSL